MNNMIYLFTAFALVWAGVLFYVVRLSGLRKQLEVRITRLEEQQGKVGRRDV